MSAVTAVPLRPLARGSVPRLWIGLALLVIVAAGLGWWGTRGVQRTIMPSGVQYQVIREGNGELISNADIVAVHFVGRHANGEPFADTRRDRPVEVTTDNFLPGLGDGLKLMRKGSVYRFWVSSRLYQGQLPPGIRFEPNEVLSFDLQVVDVAPGMAQVRRMQELQRQLQGGGQPPEAGAPGAAAPDVPAPAGTGATPPGGR